MERGSKLLSLLLFIVHRSSGAVGTDATNPAERPTDTGDCWSPDRVTLTQHNSSLFIRWTPFYDLTDLKVAIINMQQQLIIYKRISKKKVRRSHMQELHLEFKYSSAHIKAAVSAACSVKYKTSAPVLWKSVSIPNKTDAVSIPSKTDAVSIPSKTDAVSIPSKTDAVSIPSKTDAVSIPSKTDAVSIPSKTDAVSIPNKTDAVSIPNKTDVVSIPSKTDAVSTPGIMPPGHRSAPRRSVLVTSDILVSIPVLVFLVVVLAAVLYILRSCANKHERREHAASSKNLKAEPIKDIEDNLRDHFLPPTPETCSDVDSVNDRLHEINQNSAW